MLRDDSTTPAQPGREGAAMLLALEAFGRAMLGLLECKRCFVLALSRSSGFAVQAARVGFDSQVQPSADVITRLAHRPEWHRGSLFAIDPADTLATELLGREHDEPAHALAGRLSAGDGNDLVFLAGWRSIPLSAAEIACISRATSIIWATTQGFAQHRPEDPSLDKLVEELAFPAFTVDHKLRVLETNDAGRQLLLAKSPVRLDHGALVGPNSLVNNLLQQALRDTAASRSERTWANTIIPLSTDHRAFAFAWIGAAPSERHMDRLLIIIPQIDPAAGAKRIATAFGLPWAEERIVLRILRGEPPWRIGRTLDLTEATVRTYIKRIMLKLGINRQIEFFLLYILTLSPFVDGFREQLLPDEMALRDRYARLDRSRHEGA
ncbi:MAG TPA: helix-turn-helix transcriptional regulator [Bosea sp. (in: a-proteobacteria)]|jgi:DNA-binding CsgD family transcriptional regulator|uniref:helix-turn-helix transcriptional regulator n=1 Tax=Bosea sp. (in: a-proteobacteria) TaxID=1871050 RepID=UPI002E10CAC3|nr:helix-turn-helix transcriptional regulator [Bosea sp. (in: a-proteobacteria)]